MCPEETAVECPGSRADRWPVDAPHQVSGFVENRKEFLSHGPAIVFGVIQRRHVAILKIGEEGEAVRCDGDAGR